MPRKRNNLKPSTPQRRITRVLRYIRNIIIRLHREKKFLLKTSSRYIRIRRSYQLMIKAWHILFKSQSYAVRVLSVIEYGKYRKLSRQGLSLLDCLNLNDLITKEYLDFVDYQDFFIAQKKERFRFLCKYSILPLDIQCECLISWLKKNGHDNFVGAYFAMSSLPLKVKVPDFNKV